VISRGVKMDKYDHVIGIDIANKESKDFSALSMMCFNCKTVIHIEIFTGTPLVENPKACPICGVEFKNGIVRQ
jgi:rubrerythrin